ncbi:MAG: dethiobiotin synthase [Planctomycetota bacterium]
MYRKPPRGLFVTATDTEVGKTYVTSLIAKDLVASGYRVGVYKPTATDCVFDGRQLISEDAVALWEAAGRPLSLEAVCPQRFKAPISPHISARSEGRELDAQLLRTGISAWADECDIIVVEGAGGLMTPVSDDEFVADIAYDFGYPLIIVSPNMLGAINQTLSALVVANCFRDGLDIAGIVLNDSQNFEGDMSIESNRFEIASRAKVPVLTRLGYEATRFPDDIDWGALAGCREVEA